MKKGVTSMGKRIDGLVPRVINKKPKGPSKVPKSYTKEPITVSQGQLNELNSDVIEGVYKLLPEDDTNRYLLQANYWIANDNQFKARAILKGLGLKAKTIKTYIEDEASLQKRKPELSGFNDYCNKPMPQEFIVRSN